MGSGRCCPLGTQHLWVLRHRHLDRDHSHPLSLSPSPPTPYSLTSSKSIAPAAILTRPPVTELSGSPASSSMRSTISNPSVGMKPSGLSTLFPSLPLTCRSSSLTVSLVVIVGMELPTCKNLHC